MHQQEKKLCILTCALMLFHSSFFRGFTMDAEENVTGQHGNDNVRRSPRILLQKKRKGDDKAP
jgi:hypothetical protein